MAKDGEKKGGMRFHLMSGQDALDPENLLALFALLKGRKATDKERAACYVRAAQLRAKAKA